MSRRAERVEGLPVLRASLPSGRELAYLSVGAGPTVLLVPGYTGSKEDFGPVLSPLAAAGRRVVAVDMRGQLDSPGDGATESYDPDGLAGDLLELITTLDLAPVHLVGHSYGGLVSRAAVIARPDLIASLTLLCSGPAAIGGARAQVMAQLRTQLLEGGVERVGAILRMAAGGASFDTYRFEHSSPSALLGMGDALLSTGDRVDELATVLAAHAIPALVACGEGDDAWPPAVQEEMAGRLGARFAVIASAAHSPAIENPAGCAELIVQVSA